SHSTHAINILIDAIVNAVGEEYEVSEIEGDAVLLIKKGAVPSKKEILDICLKIFNAFHFQRKFMQQHTICPCGACVAIINLTLKFVVYHGPLAEIKVGRFVKHSGTEMIVAHRLLKNSIDNNEYLLLTEKLLGLVSDSAETVEMEWRSSSEEYTSIGKVDYRFALLNEARKNVPEPPPPQSYYRTDNTSYFEIPITSNFFDAYMMIMNIPERHTWMPGLQKVEQDMPTPFIGSIHHCTFENYKATISPLRMTLTDEGIMYAESFRIEEMNLSLVYEFVFKKTGENTCNFAERFMNAIESPVPKEINADLFEKMQLTAEKLKEYCEKKIIA
ncbi:MAG: DUF2652 domain-containing protein, partial [Bacteroidota bacterium]